MTIVKRMFVLILLVLVFTCKSGKESQKAGSINAGKEEDLASHFQLTPEAVVIRNGAKVVQKISPDHSTFTLDGSAPGVRDLAPGKVMLISGVDAGKVMAIRNEGKDVVVTVGPVKITDVIRNGTIEWQPKDMDMSRGTWINIAPGSKQSNLSPSLRRSPFAPDEIFEGTLYADDTNPEDQEPNTNDQEKPKPPHQHKATITVGPWKLEVTFVEPGTLRLYGARQLYSNKLAGSGQTQIQPWSVFLVGTPGNTPPPKPEAVAKFYAGVSVDINMGDLRSSGIIKVKDGEINHYVVDMPVNGSIDINANAGAGDSPAFVPRGVIEIPLEFSIPIDVGVPMYVAIKYNFFIQPELPTKGSQITLKWHSDFHGKIHMDYAPGSASSGQTVIELSEPASPTHEITSPPSLGVITVVFAAQMPRIAVGLGITSAATLGLFWDWVHALTATVGSATSLLPCKAVTLNETVSFGMETELGPKLWKDLLNKMNPSNKTKLEVFKVPLWQKAYGPWYDPHVNLCKP